MTLFTLSVKFVNKKTNKRKREENSSPETLMQASEYCYSTILFNLESISALHSLQELITKLVDTDHTAILPGTGQDDSTSGERVDMFGKKEAGRINTHGTYSLDYKTTCSTSNSYRKAEGLSRYVLPIKVGIVLVAGNHLLGVLECGGLESSQGIYALMRYNGLPLEISRS